jgi:hypothetical protein
VVALVAEAVLQKLPCSGGAMLLVAAIVNALVVETLRRLPAMLFAIRRTAAIILQTLVKETASL